ncbi:hypothetical protein HOLleu_36733 [Holothuria leucospilota]|uniref:GIY-YIG domain-containing protein n=1 Tax=Holothuria leucospilota TaxID=206669 RepID=A0A9Q0YK94_HOLLE|nr:hypothetical protein HOLleu_36733 [Holothuria leucospilota]
MKRICFNYSMKNIPLPTADAYKEILIEKIESVRKRMRWKAFFYLREDQQGNDADKEIFSYGLMSRKNPPKVAELAHFEDDLWKMVESIEFIKANDSFQRTLQTDVRKNKSSNKIFVFADKTRNVYRTDCNTCQKLLKGNVTAKYKLSRDDATIAFNTELQSIAKKLGIEEHITPMASKQAFIIFKDNKKNFSRKPVCRLINPAKSEMGIVSIHILEQINSTIRANTTPNQWRSTVAVTQWFRNIIDKKRLSVVFFNVVDIYQSICEQLLRDSIQWATQFTHISDSDIEVIMNARKSLLFDSGKAWVKRDTPHNFDLTMRSYDGAKVGELVDLSVLRNLKNHFKNDMIGIYRHNGLAAFKNLTPRKAAKIQVEFSKLFESFGLKLTAQVNLKTVNFLDVTLNLSSGRYQPYSKPSDTTLHVNNRPNHPPTVLKHIPQGVGRPISALSCDKEAFEEASQQFNEALSKSGYDTEIHHTETPVQPSGPFNRRNRKRNIIWSNPPFSKTVKNNVAGHFLRFIAQHFSDNDFLHKIFNQNKVKISYSCMPNIKSIVQVHNNRTLSKSKVSGTADSQKLCNCRRKENCPLHGKCLTRSIVYAADVSTETGTMTYIGMTGGEFKSRYNNHKKTFTNKKYAKDTELSKHIWKLKDSGKKYTIEWRILRYVPPNTNRAQRRCNLCLEEKLAIANASKSGLLNKR